MRLWQKEKILIPFLSEKIKEEISSEISTDEFVEETSELKSFGQDSEYADSTDNNDSSGISFNQEEQMLENNLDYQLDSKFGNLEKAKVDSNSFNQGIPTKEELFEEMDYEDLESSTMRDDMNGGPREIGLEEEKQGIEEPTQSEFNRSLEQGINSENLEEFSASADQSDMTSTLEMDSSEMSMPDLNGQVDRQDDSINSESVSDFDSNVKTESLDPGELPQNGEENLPVQIEKNLGEEPTISTKDLVREERSFSKFSETLEQDSDFSEESSVDQEISTHEDALEPLLEKSLDENQESDRLKQEMDSSEKQIEEQKQNLNNKSALERLQERLKKYKEKKNKQSEDTSNSELNQQLSELKPYFEREQGDGFDIQLNEEKIPDSLIRTLIVKFLNQKFCNSSDLNIRSNSLEEANGFHRWDLGQVIRHIETEQVAKIPYDKYGYRYADGKHENIPLSFYFDMSGSMASYSNLLANMAFELLRKDVKVLVGYNEKIMYQFDWVNQNMSLLEFAEVIQKGGSKGSLNVGRSDVGVTEVYQNLEPYLTKKKAEKCVVFADFDPLMDTCQLSQHTEVYWFCFEDNIARRDTSNFQGFFYQVQNEQDIANGLIEVSEYRFQTLCRFHNKNYQKKK